VRELPLPGFGERNVDDAEDVLLVVGPEQQPVNAVAELQGCHGTSPVSNQRDCNGVTKLLLNAPCARATVQKHSEKQGESRTGELGFEPNFLLFQLYCIYVGNVHAAEDYDNFALRLS
jgi:hypothetical protein